MAMVCNVCAEEARYLVYVQVEVFDLKSNRRRLKSLTLRLCEVHEVANQHFMQRDAEQAQRVATGMTPQWKRDPATVWDHWREDRGPKTEDGGRDPSGVSRPHSG